MNLLAREVLLLARKNPNELIGRRFLLLRALKNNQSNISSSLTALVSLYKTASIYGRWGKDITQLLNQHSQLHCWELAYWRFRANLNNGLISNTIVNEFVAQVNERQPQGSDIVLLSQLV